MHVPADMRISHFLVLSIHSSRVPSSKLVRVGEIYARTGQPAFEVGSGGSNPQPVSTNIYDLPRAIAALGLALARRCAEQNASDLPSGPRAASWG